MSAQENSQQSQDPIDFETALERLDGDEEFLNELLDMYFDDFNEKFPQLQKAVANEDFQSITEIGHSLKGSSANLSLEPLREASYIMEFAGRESDIEKAKKSLQDMEEEFNRLKEFLKKKT